MIKQKRLAVFGFVLLLAAAEVAFTEDKLPPNTWVAVEINWNQPLAKVADDAGDNRRSVRSGNVNEQCSCWTGTSECLQEWPKTPGNTSRLVRVQGGNFLSRKRKLGSSFVRIFSAGGATNKEHSRLLEMHGDGARELRQHRSRLSW